METAIEFCTNMFDHAGPDIKERLQAVIDNPNPNTWDDAHGIIINKTGRMTTLWQAVLSIDPSFQRRAKIDTNYKAIWESIPSSETIKLAIKKNVLTYHLN